MTDYKRLADAIVRCGVGRAEGNYYIIPGGEDADDPLVYFSEFVSDGRVVLAMMDKVMAQSMTIMIEHGATGMAFVEIRRPGGDKEMIAEDAANDITPIAIVSACVAALGEKVDE